MESIEVPLKIHCSLEYLIDDECAANIKKFLNDKNKEDAIFEIENDEIVVSVRLKRVDSLYA